MHVYVHYSHFHDLFMFHGFETIVILKYFTALLNHSCHLIDPAYIRIGQAAASCSDQWVNW